MPNPLLYGVETLFSQLTKFQLCLAFIFLMLLRIVVGYHFYKEGTAKLKSGTFTSKYFLAGAKGPLAPFFKSMLEDADGSEQLCVKKVKSDDGESVSYMIDAEQTFAIWTDFVDRKTYTQNGLGSQELKAKLTSAENNCVKSLKPPGLRVIKNWRWSCGIKLSQNCQTWK